MRVAQPIELTESEIKTLSSWSRGRRTPTRLMKRAKIILMTAEGEQNKTIAGFWELTRAKWRDGASGLFTSDWRESRKIFPGVAERRPSENRWPL